MRMKLLFPLIISVVVLISTGITALAQQGFAPDGDRPERNRPNLLATLGLSPDQVQQIKKFNQAHRPQIQEAVQRLREANRALDAAVYADAVNDFDFQTRLKEFQSAQAHVAKLRFESEFAIRKILTPDQLVRFRDLRRKFAESRQLRRNGPGRPGGRPGLKPPPPITNEF
jgi:Spy/CpxP family protein refolding chaperone